MWGNNSIGTDRGSESWISQQVCGDGSADITDSGNNAVMVALDTCRTNHQFIASQAEHLQRLRSQCATSAPITRQEIRALEVKLVRLFGQQLACKRSLPPCTSIPAELHDFPCLAQWVSVVGLTPEAVQAVCEGVATLEALLSLGDAGVSALLAPVTGAQASKLHRALHNLRRYTASQAGSSGAILTDSDAPLYWDSWDQPCPASPRSRPSPRTPHREARSSVSSSDGSDIGGSFSAISFAGNFTPHHYHHRSSDESSTPSSPPVLGLNHHPLPPPPPSPLQAVPSLTLQLPPTSTPLHDLRYTPPTTPPVIKTPKSADKKISTPPPNKKYLLTNSALGANTLPRSASHESQLTTDPTNSDVATNNHTASTPPHSVSEATTPNSATISGDLRQHNRHQSESSNDPAPSNGRPAPLSHLPQQGVALGSPTRTCYSHQRPDGQHSEDDGATKNCVPRSPRTPPLQGSMVHNVQHRFTKSINIKPSTCGYCHQKFPILGGLRCKECNFKCHKECESKLPPSCGLPNEYLKIFTESINNSLQNSNRAGGVGGVSPSHQPSDNMRTPPILASLSHYNAFQGPDSSSNPSSCNSSTPSSPALLLPPASPARPSVAASPSGAFHYPDVDVPTRASESWGPVTRTAVAATATLTTTPSTRSELVDSDRTTISTNSGSGSTDDSERTVAERVDSQDSTISDGLTEGAGGATEQGSSYSNAACIVEGEGCSRQNSVSQGLREWDIPYDEIDKGTIIGRGRFGTVYSGNWHGQCAIKELHMEYGNDEHTLEAFRSEVAMFRKTRHQNLVLFMGACMKLPRLAIITSLCKGSTLYKHIHILRDKFTMSNTISIAQQVAQGMGYLHSRGIVHKDLKSKNIFIENGKVVITDFGLVNVTRLCHNNRSGAWLSIPAGWLCYLSPELMRSLQVSSHQPHSLPHTTTTDVYSYGTVWFELLCGEWPHKDLPPEAIIWQVGRGIKPSLAHLQASRDVKDILMECWSYRPDERPDFSVLQKQLKKLPKKRLARSPSHPIHLSRSAECVF